MKAQRDIQILNLHQKTSGRKAKVTKKGTIVTSHKTNQKVEAFTNRIQSHEQKQADLSQYANKSPKKMNVNRQNSYNAVCC